MTRMAGTHRIRLTERDSMEGGVRCPSCGSYTSFSDIIATGQCRGVHRQDKSCETELAIDLVIQKTELQQSEFDIGDVGSFDSEE
ncbi:hypothetical protein SAMN04487950_3201 [Halogranum rubrum]|uniref:Uncharacterized protein n=2 Tax=Halogranum rubrum TaxID=553466 RepID=A0A1I4GCL8_9EURY|nr:hypothetical protein SAMN04487950_3201 [Halogranum rubrum]